MARQRRTPCDQCRIHRKRCDDSPSCQNCQRQGVECIRSFTHKPYENEVGFPGFAEQTWVETPRIDLEFVSETERTAIKYIVLESGIPGRTNLPPISPQSSLFDSPSSGLVLEATSPAADWHNGDRLLPRLPEMGLSTLVLAQSHPPLEKSGQILEWVDLMPLRDLPTWPLTDPSEQRLFDNFVQNLAFWLDLCDPAQHFQKDIPQKAKTSQILLNAIFALSARHLNLTDKYDQFASNRYHNECIASLKNMMADAVTFQNASLFAATIILRVLEELEMPVMASQVHLTGIKHFVDARDRYAMEGGLSEACFWVGLRQEIYSAVTNHKPIQLSLGHFVVDRSTAVADDYTWANRAVVLCADVINCCFTGFEVPRDTWTVLRNYATQWWESMPPSFYPTHERPARPHEGVPFPKIILTDGCHIIGKQHHLLSCILLAMFNPGIPRFGPGRKAAVRKMEGENIATVRHLCGIGLHNSATPPALFTASMGISICGHLFEDRSDQQAVLEVLIETERRHARPTAAIQKALKEDWGWFD